MELLLQIGTDLELSSVQIERLQRIQRELEARNQPLVDRLVEIQQEVRPNLESGDRRRGRRRRGPPRTLMEIARPPLRQIQANNRQAMEEVSNVLTRMQKRRAAELLDIDDIPRDWPRLRFP